MGKKLHKGSFERGIVRTTDNQVKKHATQMSRKEIKWLKATCKELEVADMEISEHVQDKIDSGEITFDMKEIERVLQHVEDYNIIEYNYNMVNHSKRILLRDKKDIMVNIEGEPTKSNLCFVVDITRNILVTVSYCNSKDNHSTMNWSRYCSWLKII